MYIRQIEIDNFKSFSQKTIIPFEEGFTTISGPNGSGKSNIVDSILFCLGLSTSRTMRAEKLTDLINNLSKRREASVTIVFAHKEADENREQVIVSRRIKDNGASGYASTYYLNGKVSTLTEVHDALSQYNISPGAYNVLMQGDVTGIVNMTPMERRKIIDEIAGVAEFDRKIEQAQRELLSVSGSIERFSILLEELSTRLAQLSQERDLAIKYQTLKAEKNRWEGLILAAQYVDLEKALQAAEQNIVKTRQQRKEAQDQLITLEAQVQQTREALNKIANEVKRKGEDQQIALKKQIEGLKGAVSRKKDSIQFGQEKKQENLRNLERAKEEIHRLQSKIDDLDAVMEGFIHQQQDLEKRIEKEQALLESLNQQLDALMQSSGELGSRREEIRKTLAATEDEIAGFRRQKLDVEAALEREEREKAYLLERSQASGERREALEARQKELALQVKDATVERQAFERQIQQQQLGVAKIRVALNTAVSEMNTLHREYAQLDAQKRAYEEMNFGRSVDTVLNAGIDGVHGTLAQLGHVEEEYALALEIALGGRMKSIVVDNDKVAQAGIELLQKTRAGRATFLPLNKMKPSPYLSLLPSDDGMIDYAMNLIDFDDRYRNVFAYALSDTVIVENMKIARKYLGRYRMVTLDGSLLEKTGAMTGGSAAHGAGGKLSSNKSEQQLNTLREKLAQKEAEKSRLEKELTAAELKLDTLKEDFGKFLATQQRNELALETVERELAQLEAQSEKNNAVETLERHIRDLQDQQTKLQLKIDAQQMALAQLSETLTEIDAQLPTEQVDRLKAEMDDVTFQIRNYETQSRNLQNDMQSKQMEKAFQEKGIQSYREQIEHLTENNAALEKEKQQWLEEIQLIEKQIAALEAQTGVLDEELQRLQQERDAIQARLIEEEQQKYKASQDVALIEEQILACQARKKELAPQIEAAREAMQAAGMDAEAVRGENLPSAEEMTRNIQRLTRQMEALGDVNMRAIQDYDEVMARHQELHEKIDTLTREKADLGERIESYGELKRTAFMTAFENVDRNFREIFAELSDGEGHLVLTNPEDPFSGGLTIEARPRGKKMQRMEAMSGGEKSLTALAFVFSFQRYMPAPFYAFDEVDMFLDGLNAEKLAHMVRKQSQSAQFIVVSLRKPMLEHSNRTVGVTQKRDGISKVTGVVLQSVS